MAYTIVPQFGSAKVSSADASVVDGPKWNATRVLAGGATGDVLVYDATQTSKLNGIAAVAAGSVFVSAGIATLPAWTQTPTIAGLTQIGTATLGANAAQLSKMLGLVVSFATNSSSNFKVGAQVYVEQTAATSGSAQGGEGYVSATHASGTVSFLFGTIGNVENGSANTVTEMRGVQGGCVMSSTGGGTDAKCFAAAPSGRIAGGTGTFTNGYAFHVGAFGAGFTNKYVLYSADTTAGILLSSDVAVKTTTNTWQVSSDRRLKRNVIPFSHGLDVVLALKPVSYELNGVSHEDHAGLKGISVIAQDAAAVLPPVLRELMVGDHVLNGETYLTWNSGPLIYVLMNAIRELDARLPKKAA